MPVRGARGTSDWDLVQAKIREIHPYVPIFTFGGHTHIRLVFLHARMGSSGTSEDGGDIKGDATDDRLALPFSSCFSPTGTAPSSTDEA